MVRCYLHVGNVLNNLHKVTYQHNHNKHTHVVSIHPCILDPRQHCILCCELYACMHLHVHVHVHTHGVCVCVCVCKERMEERKTPGWPRNRYPSPLPHFTIFQELLYIMWISTCTVAFQTHPDVTILSVLHVLIYLWLNSAVSK
jgi:hypothetical protein